MKPRPAAFLDQEKALAAIYQAGLEVTSILDLNQVLHSIVESVARLLGADVVTLYHYDDAQQEFIPPPVYYGISTTFDATRMPSMTGAASQIARSGEPIIASQALNHSLINRKFIRDQRIASLAGFPLKVEQSVVGVLFLSYHAQHEFTSSDVEKITILAGQAAIAIHNAELFRRQEAATKRLQVLQQAQQAIDSATGLEGVLEKMLEEGLKIVATKRGSLMLIEGEDLVTRSQFGPEKDQPGRQMMTFKVGEGLAGLVARTGQSVLCPDVWQHPDFKKPPPGKDLRFRSLLAVPIVSREGHVIGVISADDPEVGHFDETHQQILSDMAGQFATAIERMVLVDSLHALHRISERLTGVAIAERELEPVLKEIARNAVEILRIDVITIYQYDQTNNRFIVPPLMDGIAEKRPMHTEVFGGEAPWELVHKKKSNHYAPDALGDLIMNPPRPPGKGPGFVTREGIKSAAGLLLKVGEEKEIVGVMFVNYRFPHFFPEQETHILETFANSAAIAIQDARQWKNLARTQEELIQTAQMSAMGGLAAGIAHELKNPLANIMSSVNLLEMGILNPDAASAKLGEIKNEVLRARSIIDGLLEFVRSPETGRGEVDILALLSETLNLLKNQARLNHIGTDEVELRPMPKIQGNAVTLKQVFLNILTNAIEAMPDGGRLNVRTSVQGDQVRVEIQDTGDGMSAEVKERIFEPLFTTKAKSITHGVGLGLAVSHRIVHDHKGEIRVISQRGEGSTFIVSLPIGEAES